MAMAREEKLAYDLVPVAELLQSVMDELTILPARRSLPSDWHPVQTLLIAEKRKNPNMRPWQTTEEHARDVSWRIIKDWVEAQMALIETRMVTSAQVFLPDAVTKDGQTVYEYIANHTQLLLGDESKS